MSLFEVGDKSSFGKFAMHQCKCEHFERYVITNRAASRHATIAPSRSVDGALRLAFTTFVRSRISFGGVGARISVLFRVFCAVALAVVTTFHVCGAVSARDIGPAPIVHEASDVSHQGGDIDVTAEKCHICAVVSLPAALAGGATLAVPHVVPAGVSPDLISFLPSASSPPPRSLT